MKLNKRASQLTLANITGAMIFWLGSLVHQSFSNDQPVLGTIAVLLVILLGIYNASTAIKAAQNS